MNAHSPAPLSQLLRQAIAAWQTQARLAFPAIVELLVQHLEHHHADVMERLGLKFQSRDTHCAAQYQKAQSTNQMRFRRWLVMDTGAKALLPADLVMPLFGALPLAQRLDILAQLGLAVEHVVALPPEASPPLTTEGLAAELVRVGGQATLAVVEYTQRPSPEQAELALDRLRASLSLQASVIASLQQAHAAREQEVSTC